MMMPSRQIFLFLKNHLSGPSLIFKQEILNKISRAHYL